MFNWIKAAWAWLFAPATPDPVPLRLPASLISTQLKDMKVLEIPVAWVAPAAIQLDSEGRAWISRQWPIQLSPDSHKLVKVWPVPGGYGADISLVTTRDYTWHPDFVNATYARVCYDPILELKKAEEHV